MILNHTRTMPVVRTALLVLLATLMLVACGDKGSESDPQPTADVAVQVAMAPDGSEAKDLTDCVDVDFVTAAVYSSSGELLQTGGPWACEDGGGLIEDVPANQSVYVAVVGLLDGVARFRGELTEPIFLPANELVDAGTITANDFYVTLVTPVNNDREYDVYNVPLTWDPVSGAVEYWVYIWLIENSESLLPGFPVRVAASDAQSYQPDGSLFAVGNDYQWAVQAVDGAGNQSPYDDGLELGIYTRRFYLSYINPGSLDELIVTINSPDSNQEFPSGTSVPFDATVTDGDGNPVQAFRSIEWRDNATDTLLNVDGQGLNFNYDSFEPGDYTVTLTVVDTNNNPGQAEVSFSVAQPEPELTVTIQSPEPNQVFPSGTPVPFSASVTDGDGNAVEEFNSIEWRDNATGTVLNVDGQGLSFNYYNFEAGNYTVTLTVVDTNDVGGSAEVSFSVAEPETLTVTINSPESGQEFSSGTPVSFDATVTDGNGISVEAFDSVEWVASSAGEEFVLSSDPQDLSFEYYFDGDGEYTVTLTVQAANYAPGSAEVSFTVGQSEPESLIVTIQSPSSGQVFTPGDEIVFNANVTDAAGNALTVDQLSSTTWTDNFGTNLLSNAELSSPLLNFYYPYFELDGSYTVSLVVEAYINDVPVSGQASVDIQVSSIYISYPDNTGGYTMDQFIERDLVVVYAGDSQNLVSYSWLLTDPDGNSFEPDGIEGTMANFYYGNLMTVGSYKLSLITSDGESEYEYSRTFIVDETP